MGLWLRDRFQHLSSNKENYDKNVALLLTLCWYIWKGRNLKTFEDWEPQPDHTLKLAISTASEMWSKLNNNSSTDIQDSARRVVNRILYWVPPPESFLKCNSNACFDTNLDLCSIGVILRDDQCNALSDAAKILPALSPLHAEALAMREAHVLTSNLGIKIVFKIDNQELHSICKNKKMHWQIYLITKEIEDIRKNFDSNLYSWCKRDSNKVANEIARLC